MAGVFYTYDAYQRQSYYTGGSHSTPDMWMDGVDHFQGTYENVNQMWSIYKTMVSARLSVASPVTMDFQVEYGAKADSGTVHVEVVATNTIAFTDLHLRLALIEDGLSSGGNNYNQVLRDYFPDRHGISFNIAQGDTFTHSEDFIIQAAWRVENCRIVAFVQDDNTPHEVLQASQSPILIPAPEQVRNLTVTLDQDDLILNWLPVENDTHGNPLTVDHYNVYRSTTGFFEPGSEPFTTTTESYYVDDTGVVGDIETNYFYWVTAVAGYKESVVSGGAGEFDRSLITGK